MTSEENEENNSIFWSEDGHTVYLKKKEHVKSYYVPVPFSCDISIWYGDEEDLNG